jgi:LuxR family transcriptional regulator, maltose regulon positive regulatory protein
VASSGSVRLQRGGDRHDPNRRWPLAWSGRLQRGKLRRPPLPPDAAPRPRLLHRIDRPPAPLTLVVAPAGFGKTIAAAQWAAQEPIAAWITADAGDASLPRFWAHLCEAISGAVPAFGELVGTSLAVPQRASAADLGRMLADELLDAASPVHLVIDDFHLVAAGEVHEFLSGLLEAPPPGFRLLVTARSDPPLPLTRLRLRGTLRDLRGDDLLFTEEETRTIVARATGRVADRALEQLATVLHGQTNGWAAGVRLGALAIEGDATARTLAASETAASYRLLAALLDETLSGLAPVQRTAVTRAALPERFDTGLVAALLDDESPLTTAQNAVRFALESDLCRPSPQHRAEWLEFHPLFRDGLRRRLEREETPDSLRALHRRAAAWFEASELSDAAIGHKLAAGEVERAVDLVEREIQPAFAREDWPLVARWLTLLPEATIRERPQLMLAQAWLAHLRGQLVQVRAWSLAIEEWLARTGDAEEDAAAIRAELGLLRITLLVPLQIDAEGAVAIARQAIARIAPERRYPLGVAWAGLIMALGAAGRPEEAIEAATRWAGTTEEELDGGPVRGLQALLFVHTQTGALSRVESVAQSLVDLATRRRLRLAGGWARRFLADVRYERNDLEGAIDDYAVVARDYEHFHLTGLREVLFGLALAYLAGDRSEDAARVMRRCREIVTGAGSVEQLPAIEAYEAYVALRAGDDARALRWARGEPVPVDSAPLYITMHPAVIRATILGASGDPAAVAEAARGLAELRERARRSHFAGPLVRIEALAAVTDLKRGERDAALAAIRRSLATGVPNGYVRAYLDLAPLFPGELRALAREVDFPEPVRTALAGDPPTPLDRRRAVLTVLTDREREVLTALWQRLTYREIADQLFISPLTVKRHASSIYSKLGATGRSDAIRAARELGWQPAP